MPLPEQCTAQLASTGRRWLLLETTKTYQCFGTLLVLPRASLESISYPSEGEDVLACFRFRGPFFKVFFSFLSSVFFVFQGGLLFGLLAFVAFTWAFVAFVAFHFASSAFTVSLLFVFSHPLHCQFRCGTSSAFPVLPWLPASSASQVPLCCPRHPVPPSPPLLLFRFLLPLIESSLFRVTSTPPKPPATFWIFLIESSLFHQPPRYVLGVSQGLVCPELNPHFYHHEGDPPLFFTCIHKCLPTLPQRN